MTVKRMERNKPCTCLVCGDTFLAVRYNAQTCSDKCRKRLSRLKEQPQEVYDAAMRQIEILWDIAEHGIYSGTSRNLIINLADGLRRMKNVIEEERDFQRPLIDVVGLERRI